jgi:hypothetical protein
VKASTRQARRTIKARATQTRAAARIARRGTASLTTHAIAAGLTAAEARSVASSLRRNAAKLGLAGTTARVHAGRRMRTTHRYTPAQVAQAALTYRPRKPAYRVARAYLLAA